MIKQSAKWLLIVDSFAAQEKGSEEGKVDEKEALQGKKNMAKVV